MSFEAYKRFNRYHLPETFDGKTDITDLIRFLREYADFCASRNLDYDGFSVRHFINVETFGRAKRQHICNYVLNALKRRNLVA